MSLPPTILQYFSVPERLKSSSDIDWHASLSLSMPCRRHVDAKLVSRALATLCNLLRLILQFHSLGPNTMQSSSFASFTLKDKQKLLANLDIEGAVITQQFV